MREVQLQTEPRCIASLTAVYFLIWLDYNQAYIRVGVENDLQLSGMLDFEGTELQETLF